MSVVVDDECLEGMERDLCGLAARVAASMCEFLLAVAVYDGVRGWERWECHDMAGWLSWKCGVAPGTAREYVRVARALEDLPLIRERFRAGRLSYSQVRALTRVATGASEPLMVGLAESSTGAQLERIVRAYRRCEEAQLDTAERRDQGRYLRLGWDDDGNVVGSFRLPAETGTGLMTAIEAATTRQAVDDADADGAREPVSAARADALVELVTSGHRAGSDHCADGPPEVLLKVIVEQAALGSLETADGGDSAGEGALCQVEDGPGLAGETARRLGCDAEEIRIVEDPAGNVLDVGRRTRRIGRRLREALRRRDGRCQFPGCDRLATQAHHIVHWADGGPTDLANLISLCWCHHRRVHEGGYRIITDPDGQRRFQHPNGSLLDPRPAQPKPGSVPAPPAVAAFQDRWDGSQLDLPLIIDCILQTEDRLIPPPPDSPTWN